MIITSLGNSLFEIIKLTPKGVLIFFPSYKLLETYRKSWFKQGIIEKIQKFKEVFFDTKENEDKTQLLSNFDNSCSKSKKGCILFSVCRGTYSEGVNFESKNIVMVIIIGIPYAYMGDPKIKAQDKYIMKANKLFQNFFNDNNITNVQFWDWYGLNALKSVNQSLGRLFRNKSNYGIILLIDVRYNKDKIKNYISSWIRKYFKVYDNSNGKLLLDNISSFYDKFKITH